MTEQDINIPTEEFGSKKLGEFLESNDSEPIPGEELATFCNNLQKKVIELSQKGELTEEEQSYISFVAKDASNFMALILDNEEIQLPNGDDAVSQEFASNTHQLINSINVAQEGRKQVSLEELSKGYSPNIGYSFMLLEVPFMSRQDISGNTQARKAVENCTVHLLGALSDLVLFNANKIPGQVSTRKYLKSMANLYNHVEKV